MIPARVSIGNHQYVVDISKAIRRPISSMRQAVDQGGEPSEQSLDNQALWKRTMSDFILGQGQAFYDQENESDRRRCRAISGFDPLTDRRALTSAKAMGSVAAAISGGTVGFSRLVKTRSNWWVVPTGSGQLRRTASLTNFTMTNVTGGISAWTDATVFGDTMYVADGGTVYSGSITGSSVSSFSSVDTDVIDAGSGRLICGRNNLLFELTNAGVQVSIYTHPNTTFDWVDFAPGNAGIYCAGHDGLRSELYLVTVIDATGALAPPFPVAQLPAGELIRSIEFFGGFLAITTNRGVRIAQASQAGLLSYGPLLPLGDTAGVQFDGRMAYVTCNSLPIFTGPAVVQLAMDRFTAPLTPAYAGAFPISSAMNVHDVGTDNGQVVALTASGTQVQLFSTASAFAPAQFWSGVTTYGTPEPKVLQSVEIIFDALPASCTITAQVWDKQGGTMYGTYTEGSAGATKITLTPSTEMRTEGFELYLSTTGTSQITVRRWTIRAVVAPKYLSEEIILPLMLAKQVTSDTGQTMPYNPEEEWNYLSGLMRRRTPVELTFGNETVDVWVDQVGSEQGWHSWDIRDTWPEGTVFVRLISVEESV